MPEGQGNTERYTVEQVIAALRAAGGIKLGAAQKLGCSPTTIQAYIERHPEIAVALVEIKSNTIDLAETKLVQAIGEGNMTAIIFFLKTQAKDRGYVERVEQTGKNGAPIQNRTANIKALDVSKFTTEQLEEFEKLYAIATKGDADDES